MAEFIEAFFSFPTVVFSFLLVAVLLYWLTVILGVFDIDLLDAGELDLEASSGTMSGMMAGFGLSGVPSTVGLSLLVVWTWLLVMLASLLIQPLLPEGLWQILGGLLIVVVVLPLALLITTRCLRPLKPLFRVHEAPRKHAAVGKLCRISSLAVSERHGQAYLEDGGAGLILSVRCTGDNNLTRGSLALIVDYDGSDDSFEVVAADEALASYPEKSP